MQCVSLPALFMASADSHTPEPLCFLPLQVVRTLDAPPGWEKEHDDEDHVAWLTHETVQVCTRPW